MIAADADLDDLRERLEANGIVATRDEARAIVEEVVLTRQPSPEGMTRDEFGAAFKDYADGCVALGWRPIIDLDWPEQQVVDAYVAGLAAANYTTRDLH